MPDRDGKKKGYGSLLLFFVFMLLFTLVSRAYDTFTVPKVRTAYAKSKNIEMRVQGYGRIQAEKTVFCQVRQGYRVGEVPVSQGKVVEEGDVLFRYQLASLLEQQKRLETEMEKYRLALEKETVNARVFSGMTQMQLAGREAEAAASKLERGRREYEEAQAESMEELRRLKEEYGRRASVMKEELLRQLERDYESGLGGLGGSKNSRDAALRTARRAVEDLEEELQALIQDGGDEDEEALVRKKLERAQEDLEELEELWEEQLDAKRQDLDYIDEDQSRIHEGRTSGQIEMRLGYEEQVRQEEEKLREKEREVEMLEEALQAAEEKKGIAAVEDEKARLTKEQREQLGALNRKEIELDLEELEGKLQELEGLILAEGAVIAPAGGTVLRLELTAGQLTTGTELVQIGTGGLMFEGDFTTGEEEKQPLFPGDRVMVGRTGQPDQSETVVETVNLLGEQAGDAGDDAGSGTFLAKVTEGTFLIGERTRYESVKQSDPYDLVIPIEGLRKDQNGYYCLVVRIRDSVLGQEQVVGRVDLTVLEKGDKEAAVEGALYQDDAVVVECSRMIEPGSRVRVMDEGM